MTKITAQFAAFALSALMTAGLLAGANGLAGTQYAAAERLALAAVGQTQIAQQTVVVVGRRAEA